MHLNETNHQFGKFSEKCVLFQARAVWELREGESLVGKKKQNLTNLEYIMQPRTMRIKSLDAWNINNVKHMQSKNEKK